MFAPSPRISPSSPPPYFKPMSSTGRPVVRGGVLDSGWMRPFSGAADAGCGKATMSSGLVAVGGDNAVGGDETCIILGPAGREGGGSTSSRAADAPPVSSAGWLIGGSDAIGGRGSGELGRESRGS